VEEWAGNMSKTIAASIRVLEDNLQGRDKELQDFITIVPHASAARSDGVENDSEKDECKDREQ